MLDLRECLSMNADNLPYACKAPTAIKLWQFFVWSILSQTSSDSGADSGAGEAGNGGGEGP